MGNRLEILETKSVFYGTKLYYGYVDNERELKSYQYLVDNGFFYPPRIYGIYTVPLIELPNVKFEGFCKLYAEDLKEHGYTKEDLEWFNGEMKDIIQHCKDNPDEDIILTWG